MFGSVDEIIDALGGTKAVAEAHGVNLSVVSSWRFRRSIPADRWRDIVALAEARGVEGLTFETLAVLHAKPRPELAEARA